MTAFQDHIWTFMVCHQCIARLYLKYHSKCGDQNVISPKGLLIVSMLSYFEVHTYFETVLYWKVSPTKMRRKEYLSNFAHYTKIYCDSKSRSDSYVLAMNQCNQVGGGLVNSTTPDDNYCWERPEDMDYARPVQTTYSGPDLAGEMAAAFAAASIVFRDDIAYSAKLVKGAATVFAFARDFGKRTTYSKGNPYIKYYYNSTGYYDEYMWGSAWLYFATGNTSYISLATNPGISKNAKAFLRTPKLSVLSWDNKLPAAMLLLTRLRIFLNPGYPYENMLQMYQNVTGLTMCSYLQNFHVFNWTQGTFTTIYIHSRWFFTVITSFGFILLA